MGKEIVGYNLMFLSIKKIPKVLWSSAKPFNLKPKLSTLFFLCFGLTLFGINEVPNVNTLIGGGIITSAIIFYAFNAKRPLSSRYIWVKK